MRDLDYDRLLDTAAFLESYRITVKSIAEYEKARGRSSYSMTLAGFANATHAAFYMRQSRYFAAIGTGLDAIRGLNEAQKMDSTNYDVEFFLGLYDYAKAELRKRLWMVLFWYGGDKQEGIARLKDCVEKSEMAGPAAKLSLADIYIQEKEYTKARATIDELLADYPKSRFILWTDAKYFFSREEFVEAAKRYGQLADSYAKTRYGTFNSLATRWRQIETLRKAGKDDEARKTARTMKSGQCGNRSSRSEEPCREVVKFLKKKRGRAGE